MLGPSGPLDKRAASGSQARARNRSGRRSFPSPERRRTGPEAVDLFHGARFSPDGRWTAYHKNETGQNEIYLQPVKTEGSLGPKQLVSADGGVRPAGGRTKSGEPFELLYQNRGKLLALEVDTTSRPRVSEPNEVLDTRDLRAQLIEPLPDGRFLIAQNEKAELEEATRISVVLNWFEELERAFSGATR